MTGNNNNNLIPKENYKKVEEVREINNEVPSFEEFMKTYEYDANLNYDDLTYSDISDKGERYGPCSACNNSDLKFELEMILKNSDGSWRKKTVYNVDDARKTASEILTRTGHWMDNNPKYGDASFSREERKSLADRINNAIDEHINDYKNINKVVENDIDDDYGGKSCGNVIM